MLQSLILAMGGVGSSSALLALRGRSLLVFIPKRPLIANADNNVVTGAAAASDATFTVTAGDRS